MEDHVWAHYGKSFQWEKKSHNAYSKCSIYLPIDCPGAFRGISHWIGLQIHAEAMLVTFPAMPFKDWGFATLAPKLDFKNPLLVQSYSCDVWIKCQMLQWAAPLFFHEGQFWTACESDKFAVLGKRINVLELFFLKKKPPRKKGTAIIVTWEVYWKMVHKTSAAVAVSSLENVTVILQGWNEEWVFLGCLSSQVSSACCLQGNLT